MTVPGAFISRSGAYILFAQLEGVDPAVVMMYEASTHDGEQR